MKINNITDAEEFIDSLTDKRPAVAGMMLAKAIESLELGQMYYEQNDNERGIRRLAGCLRILKDYQ
ncbi:MAG TPA: hypothetical protein ENK33_07515 [Desulfobacterales bacterium]|uniref:Uncharacterized protein n=1 Tax=hydrothermal vent metagenome TaxID=652676 RepID=A0A3B0V8K9_9ZZZZ|nr:hypothetical protein [Desulfobacterales bacterium]